MLNIKENDKNLIVSKSAVEVLPNREEVNRMIELEEKQAELRNVLSDANANYNPAVYIERAKNVVALFLSSTFLGCFDAADITILCRQGFNTTNVVSLVINTLAFAPLVYITAKNEFRLRKEVENVQVQFNQIKSTLEKEIDNLNNEQMEIAGDDLELKNAHIKLKML